MYGRVHENSGCNNILNDRDVMCAISAVLTLWEMGFASVEDVVAWADAEIAKSDCARQELIDLSLAGPARCTKRSEIDFPCRSVRLTCQEEFALRAAWLDLDVEESVYQFAAWAAGRCMGEDLTDAIVKFGYELDHMICDCNDSKAAIAHTRQILPTLTRRHMPVVGGLLDVARDLNPSLVQR